MDVNTRDTTRELTAYGLYVEEPDELPDDLPRKPDGDAVTSETPGIKYFCISDEIDANSTTGGALSTMLCMHGIPPWDVVEFQTLKVERTRTLEADTESINIPPEKR
jgi:hypothetical protein